MSPFLWIKKKKNENFAVGIENMYSDSFFLSLLLKKKVGVLFISSISLGIFIL